MRAYTDADGNSLTTNEAWSVTHLAATGNPQAVWSTDTSVGFSWTDTTGGVAGTEIHLQDSNGIAPDPIATVGPGQTSVVIGGMSPDSSYAFYFRSVTAAQTSGWSGEIDGDTRDPGTPANLTATPSTNSTAINLQWARSAYADGGSNIYRSNDGGQTFSYLDYAEEGDYTDTATAPSTTYSYYVASILSGSEAGTTNSATVTTSPAAATSLTVTTVSANEIDLSWTASTSTDVNYYTIYASADGVTFDAIDSVAASQTSYAAAGLIPGTTFTFKVTAANAADAESAFSNSASATTSFAAATDLTATVSHSGEIDLSWADNSLGTAGASIYYSTDGTNFTLLDTVDVGVNTYAATELIADGTYTFKVITNYTTGSSDASAPITATAITSELAATGDESTDEGVGYVLDLSSMPSDGLSAPIVSWEVDWHDGFEGSSDVETVEGDSASTLGHVFADGYQGGNVSVTAIDGDGNHFVLPDATVSVIPAAPSDLQTGVFGRNQIDLTWTDNSDAEGGFTILRSDDGGATFNEIGTADANATSYSDVGLDPNTSHSYEVTASGGADGSAASSAASAAPATTPSGNLVQVGDITQEDGNVNYGDAQLAWTYAGQDDSGFELEVKDQTIGENYHLLTTLSAITDGSEETYLANVLANEVYSFRMRVDYTDGTVSDYVDMGTFALSLGVGPSITATPQPFVEDENAYPILVSWSPPADPNPSGVGGYMLQYKATSISPGWTTIHPDTDSGNFNADMTWCDAGSVNGDYYQFRVCALYNDGTSSNWNYAEATEGGPTIATDAHVTVVSDTEIAVDISADSSGAQYTIFQSQVNAHGMAQDTSVLWDSNGPFTEAVHRVCTVAPGSHYYFGVSIWHYGQTDAPWSVAMLDASTAGGNITPGAPDGLVAVRDPKDAKKIDLHWHNNSSNETGFLLEFSPNSNFDEFVTTVTPSVDETAYIDSVSALWPAAYYRVKALGQTYEGSSGWSTVVSLTRTVAYAYDEFINGVRGTWVPEPWAPLFNTVLEDTAEFRTDMRNFGQFNWDSRNANARLASFGWIDASTIGHAAQLGVDYTGASYAGYSHRRIRPYYNGAPFPWTVLPAVKSPVQGIFPVVTNRDASTTDIEFKSSAAYPYLPGPTVMYDVTFEFKVNYARTEITVSVSGSRTHFPDAEAYFGKKTYYSYSSPGWGPRPWNLSWGGLDKFSAGPFKV